MKKTTSRLLACFTLFFSFSGMAQNSFTDNFTDSNLTVNPTWTGDVSKFEINSSKQLQLNHTGATGTSAASLVTASTIVNDALWEFYVQLDFSPSTSNFAKVYLTSNNQDLSANLEGYYIQIGGQSGTIDNVRLMRQDGATDTLLIDGTSGTVAASPTVKIRVIKSATNEWSLFLDQSGVGNTFQLEGTAIDSKYGTSNYFGVYCKYTSTRFDKFFFDDFIVNGIAFQDTSKPVFTQVNLLSDRKLELTFNEKLDSTAALILTNYSINNGIGNPSSANFTSIDSTTIELDFTTPFVNGSQYNISVQNVADKAGNVIQSSTQSFTYFIPVASTYRDIVINEIFPDYTPTNGLPEAEFLELFNASNKVFDLSGWSISDASTTSSLTTHILRPGDFIILCSQTVVLDFQAFGTTQALSSFPSLNNAGDNVTLKDNNGTIIDFVNYTDNWYQNPAKEDGGFSLEQINPFTDCIGSKNFIASNAIVGGTPGIKNSTFDTLPDTKAPEFINAFIIANDTLLLEFDEFLDTSSAKTATYFISPTKTINQVIALAPEYTSLVLVLNTPLDSGVIYNVTVSGLNDCSGNEIDEDNLKFIAIPDNADSSDLIINEILFNPKGSNSADFVELYNRSEKVIGITNWTVANVIYGTDGDPDIIGTPKLITEQPLILLPKEYIVITKDKENIIQEYPNSIANTIFEVSGDLPSYNNDKGSVLIYNSKGNLIDRITYTDDQHFVLLSDDDGVSLERINSEKSSLDVSNWHSASEKVGFATPGYKNSQDFTNPKSNGTINLDPKIISPNNDGFQDLLAINYKFNAPGFVATVSIFDRNGRLIKRLVNNELLGSDGVFYWDGITEENNKARIGIYVLIFEAFNLNGDKEIYKNVFTVASQLK